MIEAASASVAQLVDCGLYDAERKIPDVKRWLAEEAYAQDNDDHHHHHDVNRHDEAIRAFTLASDRAIPFSAFEMFLDLVRSMHGPNLLRVKGIVKLAESPDRPVVIHGVQHVFHPPATLAAWPDADHRTRLVFIVNGIEERVIKDLFNAFLGIAQPDRPDRAALTTESATTPFRAFRAERSAIPFSAFEMFLDLVRSMYGPNLLRMKGIVKLAEQPDRPVVIHGVQHVFHPPATLAAWPDADQRMRLVFIVNGIEER